METSLVFHFHPTEVTWEEYAFGRLSEKKIPPLEEHLLVCEMCQASLEEATEYIQLMKAGLIKTGLMKARLMRAGRMLARPAGLAGAARFLGAAVERLRNVMCATVLAAGCMGL